MLAALAGGMDGIGLGYACALLQVQLAIGLAIGGITLAVSKSSELRRQLANSPWQAALRADAAAAAPALMLAAFAMLQVRAEAMGLLTMVGLLMAGLSVFVGFMYTFLTTLCGGEVPDVDAVTGDITEKAIGKVLSMAKAVGLMLLLFAPVPGSAQLTVASALMRLAFMAEAFCAFASTCGFRESGLAEACIDVVRALQVAPLLGALAIMDHMAWGSSSVLSLPFQPGFYCSIALAAQVALILLLSLGCGGGLQEGSAACKRVAAINRLAGAGLCLGLLGCIVSVAWGTCEFALSTSGINIQWGEPMVATAIALTKLVFLAQLLEVAAPEPVEATPQENNHHGHEAAEAEAEGGDEALEQPAAQPQVVSPGISEPMKVITARAPGIALALVAMQMSSSEASHSAVDYFLAVFNLPFRIGFPICIAAMWLQVILLLAFTFCHCEEQPVPVPSLDGTGTLVWSQASKVRTVVLVLLQGGLFVGILGLGFIRASASLVAFFAIILPCLPKEGKSNIASAMGWIAHGMQSCGGVFGSQLEAYMAQRRKLAEAAAAKKAEEVLADEGDEEKKPKKNPKKETETLEEEEGGKKKKVPNPSPKKAAPKASKKKKN